MIDLQKIEAEKAPKGLIARLIKAALEMKAAERQDSKRKEEKFAFKYVGHAAATQSVREPLLKQGVFMVPTIVERHDVDVPGGYVHTRLKIQITFIDIDGDQLSMITWGDGIGKDDKNVGKAFSYAVKYALLKTFLIPTEDDDDIEKHPVQVSRQSYSKSTPQKAMLTEKTQTEPQNYDFKVFAERFKTATTLAELDQKKEGALGFINEHFSATPKQKEGATKYMFGCYKRRSLELEKNISEVLG